MTNLKHIKRNHIQTPLNPPTPKDTSLPHSEGVRTQTHVIYTICCIAHCFMLISYQSTACSWGLGFHPWMISKKEFYGWDWSDVARMWGPSTACLTMPFHRAGTVPWQQGWVSSFCHPPAEWQQHLRKCTVLFVKSQELGQRKASSPWKSSFLGSMHTGFLLWCSPPVRSAWERNHPTQEMSAFCQRAKVKAK